MKGLENFIKNAQSKIKTFAKWVRWFADFLDWLANTLASIPFPKSDGSNTDGNGQTVESIQRETVASGSETRNRELYERDIQGEQQFVRNEVAKSEADQSDRRE